MEVSLIQNYIYFSVFSFQTEPYFFMSVCVKKLHNLTHTHLFIYTIIYSSDNIYANECTLISIDGVKTFTKSINTYHERSWPAIVN